MVIRGVCTDSPRTSEELELDILEHVRAEAALKWLLGVGHGNHRIRSPLALDVYAVSQDWGVRVGHLRVGELAVELAARVAVADTKVDS